MKKILSEVNILKLIILLPIVAIIITAVILTNIFIDSEKQALQKNIVLLKENYINNIKTTIQSRVNRAIDIINIKNEIAFEEDKKQLKDLVNMSYKIIESLHQEYSDRNKEAILKEIKHHLRKIRFYENQSGYFYIFDMEGKNILHPIYPHLEGSNLINQQDIKGKNITKKVISSLKENDEAYNTWYWNKTPNNPVEKLGFYKKYEPLNLYVGTGRYFDDIHEENSKHTYSMLSKIKYEDNNYLFVLKDNGTTVVHPNKKILNKKFEDLSLMEQKVVQNLLTKKNKKEGAFIEYKPTTQIKENTSSSKISFIKYMPDLKLTIGTGIYLDNLQLQIEEKTKVLEKKLITTTNKIILSACIVTAILIFIMLIISNSLKGILNQYAKELAQKNVHLKELNENLEKRVNKEVKKNRQQDEILNQQAKMAAMGEMLGNISHQWRQPLSAISTSASGIKLQDELNVLNKEEMYKDLEGIVKNTKILSNTIDDFRNFLKPNKESTEFSIKSCLDNVFILISANLKNHNITIVQTLPDIEIYGYHNELVQALLNIINNAKDAISELKDKEHRYIFIDAIEEKDEIIITIKDNANGIDDTIINRIFEPYFTTKHQTHGTGIGLFMTKKIIENNLRDSITIRNEDFIYLENSYTGAVCTIRLPKNI